MIILLVFISHNVISRKYAKYSYILFEKQVYTDTFPKYRYILFDKRVYVDTFFWSISSYIIIEVCTNIYLSVWSPIHSILNASWLSHRRRMSNNISDADVAHRDAIYYLFVKNTKMNGCRSKLINFSFHILINLNEAKKYKKKHICTCTCTGQQPISRLP
jgi:hypothetical protein